MSLHALFEPTGERGLARAVGPQISDIQKSAVVTGGARGGAGPLHLYTGEHPRRGVVDNGTTFKQALLECVSAFAEIVREPHQISVRLCAEVGGKLSAQRGCTCQVLRDGLVDGLAVFILPDVCVIWHALPSHFSPNSKNQPCEITELTSRGRDPALRIKLVRLSYRIR